MAGTLWSTTEAGAWIREVWEPGIAIAAYDEMRVATHFKKLASRDGKTIHFRKLSNLARQTLAGTAAGSDLTFSGQTEGDTVATPNTTYVAVEVNFPTLSRLMNDPSDTFRRAIEMSIAEGVDADAAAKASLMTTNVIGSDAVDIDQGLIELTLEKLATTAKMYFKPGESESVYIVHPLQIGNVLSVGNVGQYQMRGDGTSPVVKGWVARAYGFTWYESGNIQQAGSPAYKQNMAFIPDVTFGIAYFQEPTVKMEEYQLSKRIIGWTDFALMACWEQYGVLVKTKIT